MVPWQPALKQHRVALSKVDKGVRFSPSPPAGAVASAGGRYNRATVVSWRATMTSNLSTHPPQVPEAPGVLAPVDGSASDVAEAPRGARLGEQAWAAFQRDYPQLLQQRCGQWVAYRGDERVGFAPTASELHHECLHRRYQPHEFAVCTLCPVAG